MKKTTTTLALTLIILTFLLTDPVDLVMPTPIQMTILALVVLLYVLFVGMIFREKPRDEREVALLAQSSRVAFLTGTAVLVVGIISQLLRHDLDNWLIWTLSSMVLAKVIWLNKNT